MKVEKKTKYFFGIGGFGKDMMFAMSTIMSIYFIAYVGISAAFVGIMFLAVRVFDAINDPIMGWISDNTKSRWGKFRPWILVGTILNAIVLLFVFYKPDLAVDSISMLIYITVFYMLWGVTYTLMDIPFWALIPALSDDQKERESTTTIVRLFTSLGFFVISAPFIIVVTLLGGGESRNEMLHGFFLLAIIVSVIFLISQIILITKVKENITVENTEKITLKGMFSLLKANDQLFVVVVVMLVANFALFTTAGMSFFYIKYDLGKLHLLFPFLAAGGTIQLAGILLYPLLSKKYPRKKIFNMYINFQVVAFILLLINALILGNNITFLFAFGAIVFFWQGTMQVMQTVLLADTVEYGEVVTKRRSESIIFALQTFIAKLATGLSVAVVGVGLAIIGFVPEVQEQAVVQTEVTIYGIRLIMFVLPIFALMLSKYIFNKKHFIDEQKYANILEELAVQRSNPSKDKVCK